MNIAQKHELSQQLDCVHFFREGIFVHVYFASLYIVMQHFAWPLKLSVIGTKSCYLRAGIPIKTLLQKCPNLETTDYGYKLIGHWHMVDYEYWYDTQLSYLKPAILTLTPSQKQFLTAWQLNDLSASPDAEFIMQLKKLLTD